MKTITLTIVKKNRVYFACKDSRGYDVKLKIDDLSKDLELKEQELIVDDISVRTKYGTDVIYQLAVSADSASKDAGFCTLSHHTYNSELVKKCRELAGAWDADAKVWVFPKIVQEQVEELDEYYNSNESFYDLQLEDGDAVGCAPYALNGVILAIATGRDSGARLADNVILLKGGFKSGGSMKNWTTKVNGETIVRVKLSENLAKSISNFDDVIVTKVEKQ